uniref:EF-hand domain-containing protein n=1 Tax=Alexandrium catenella TaxID=2925 RepID=A0A7S1WGR0_ALECA|mmetsp:Transcript_59532/g.159496  ORF Transcript_59532/g.159496 Transcript_59532/m.159496 type:complete len:449 (+) Transcript_59532:116-1462(+)
MVLRLLPRLLPAQLLLGAVVAITADVLGSADDAVTLLQVVTPSSAAFEVGDEVDVEGLEGVPGSNLRGVITGTGAQPSTYSVAVWEAPPEHRFMSDVAASSIRLYKAHPTYAPVATNLQAGMDLFSAIDGDRNGAITRGEFVKAVSQLAGASTSTVMAAAAAAVPRVPSTPLAEAPAEEAAAALSVEAARAPPPALEEATPPAAPAVLPAGTDCWVEGYTSSACCDLYWGPSGDDHCWNGIFTFQRCCKPDEQVVQEAERYTGALSAEGAESKVDELERQKAAEEEKRKKEEAEKQRTNTVSSEEQREMMRKAEAEARERYDAELKRRAKEEERQMLKEQAKLRAEKREEEEAKRKAEEAEQLEFERKACPDGFQYFSGDAPGFDQFGHEDKLKRKSVEACAKECTKTSLCQSFEWSPTKTQCNLNKVSEPKAAKFMDFVFCKRLKKA